MREPEPNQPPGGILRFRCGGCGQDLEAPAAYAGVEGPCPGCALPVRAPLREESAVLDLPAGFWDAPGPEEPEFGAKPGTGPPVRPMSPPAGGGPRVSLREVPDPGPGRSPEIGREAAEKQNAGIEERPRTAEDEAAVLRHRKRRRCLRMFDAALVLLFLGMLALGGAALAFTEPKSDLIPPAPPQLSAMVLARMQAMDEHRDQSIQSARLTLEQLLAAPDKAAAEPLLLPDDQPAAGLTFPCLPDASPRDFDFIQARRIPGSDRFLTLFELPARLPLVIPVEETPAGTRVHGQALAQQSLGLLGVFLARQGQGAGEFYVLLRPAPEPMAADLLRNRPDLNEFQLIAVEPAFPADGGAGCLACLEHGSEAAAIFARRAHDPGLRPAVVKLVWRQHRESGTYVQLADFVPNAWSRH